MASNQAFGEDGSAREQTEQRIAMQVDVQQMQRHDCGERADTQLRGPLRLHQQRSQHGQFTREYEVAEQLGSQIEA